MPRNLVPDPIEESNSCEAADGRSVWSPEGRDRVLEGDEGAGKSLPLVPPAGRPKVDLRRGTRWEPSTTKEFVVPKDSMVIPCHLEDEMLECFQCCRAIWHRSVQSSWAVISRGISGSVAVFLCSVDYCDGSAKRVVCVRSVSS